MTLIATPMATNANSFATVVEADAYHDARLHNAEWLAITDVTDKEKALIWATRLLNALTFRGLKTTIEQSLKMPRNQTYDDDGNLLNIEIIPDEIKNATAELAFLLYIKDTTRASGDKGFKSIKVAVINLVMNADDRNESISKSTLDMIRPWLVSSSSKSVYKA